MLVTKGFRGFGDSADTLNPCRPGISWNRLSEHLGRIPGEGLRAPQLARDGKVLTDKETRRLRGDRQPLNRIRSASEQLDRRPRCCPWSKSSMPRAAIDTASRCGTPIFAHGSSSRARTGRSRIAFTGFGSVSTLMFRESERTRGAATDSAPACTRLRGWTGSPCAG